MNYARHIRKMEKFVRINKRLMRRMTYSVKVCRAIQKQGKATPDIEETIDRYAAEYGRLDQENSYFESLIAIMMRLSLADNSAVDSDA